MPKSKISNKKSLLEKKAKGNKGEWSEFYALVKLLSDGSVSVSDKDSISEMEYKSLHSLSKDDTLFQFLDENEIICIQSSSTEIINKDALNLKNGVQKLFACIKDKGCEEKGERGSFELPFAEEIATALKVSTKKAQSTEKGDLIIKFSTNSIGSEPKPHEVSIKSWIGANPTLFNASIRSSRLIFEVIGNVPFEVLESFSSKAMKSRRPREGIKEAVKLGVTFKFSHYFDKTFELNLAKFDANKLISMIVFAHFSRPEGEATTSHVLKQGIDDASFEHKWKTFLERCALGMTAGKEYNESNNIADNFLVIGQSGDIYCFIGRNRLQNLLYEQAIIDTPSTNDSKHQYGYFYMEDNKIYIDLNFQVRLKPIKKIKTLL